MKRYFALAAAFTILSSASISLADCKVVIDRTACPGKEKAALKPYDGKNPTTDDHPGLDAAACVAKAKEEAPIKRKGTLAKKVATAMVDGKEAGKAEATSECK